MQDKNPGKGFKVFFFELVILLFSYGKGKPFHGDDKETYSFLY